MNTSFVKLPAGHFLERALVVPVIDVRTPQEFFQGHIPGAINLPLFDDKERAVVGTTYAHAGSEEAILSGLEIVGPKLKELARKAIAIAIEKEVLVYCWRGGMRSGAMAWLFSFSGIKTSLLDGGYKAYRRYINESFGKGPEMIVLSGMTGSGKTALLHQLSGLKEQIIDLEGLANHKGSAFGALGKDLQPANEQFENNLAAKWLALDPSMPVWIEDESRNIGKVIIPDPIYRQMSRAKVVIIDVPFEERVKRLCAEYGVFENEQLIVILEKIRKRVGGDVANETIRLLKSDNLDSAISLILKYYDKTYQYGLSKRGGNKSITITAGDFLNRYAELRKG
jgi:tRNA 2-selenouridine synthase